MTEFQVEEISSQKRKWMLQFHPGHLTLSPEGEAQPFVFLREDFFNKLEFAPGMRLLMLKAPPKVAFKLEKDAAAEFKNWFGVPSTGQLKLLLKRRYWLSLPLAVLFIIASLPLGGDESAGIKPIAASPFNLIMGVTLLALWITSRIRPHPILFLLDAAWFAVLGLGQLPAIYRDQSWWWLIWVLLLLWIASNGMKLYRWFIPRRI